MLCVLKIVGFFFFSLKCTAMRFSLQEMTCSPLGQSPIVGRSREAILSHNHMRIRKMSFGAGIVWLGNDDVLLGT